MERLAATVAFLLVAMPAFAAEDLVGSHWRAEDIGGAGVMDRGQPTLQIMPEGRIAGSGGCNRYTGAGTLANGKATIGQLASTRMACPPTAMNQEAKFLAALASATRYEVRRDGLLILMDPNGLPVLRFSRI